MTRTTLASVMAATLSLTAMSSFAATSLTELARPFLLLFMRSGQTLIRKKQVIKQTIRGLVLLVVSNKSMQKQLISVHLMPH